MAIEFDGILVNNTASMGYYCKIPFNMEKAFGKKRVNFVPNPSYLKVL